MPEDYGSAAGTDPYDNKPLTIGNVPAGPAASDPFDNAAATTGFEEAGRRLLPGWIPKLMLFCLLAFAALGIARCKDRDEGYARVADISPSARSASKISPQQSPAYKEQLDVYSERKAEEAMKKEGSFVAPATGADIRPAPKGPVLAQEAPAAPVKVQKQDAPAQGSPVRAGPPADKKPAAARRQDAAKPDDGLQKKRMLQYLTAVRQQKVPARGAQLVLGGIPDTAAGRTGKAEAPAPADTGLPGLKAGDILLAVNRVTLDSDAPGPCMAEVVLGPYKGAKAVGSFARHGEHLVLSFAELVTRDGESIAIQACAIDPETDRTAVRTSVDTHALERFGGLIASSFLEGFGDATRRSGTTSYASVYGAGSSVPRYSLSDEAWIAGGKVGERLGRQMEKNFDRAPTVVLKSGTSMGILLLRTAQKKEAGSTTQKEKAAPGLTVR